MQDEVWQLPYGHIHTRKKGEALHEARESLTELQDILQAVGGHPFSYQYMQGAYHPRFGEEGHGSVFLTPYREGEVWDPQTSPMEPHGFYRLDEADFIRPKVFGIGEDPYPANMRTAPTMEEWTKAAQELREEMLLPSGDINPDWIKKQEEKDSF